MAYVHYLPRENFRCRVLRWHDWRGIVEGKWDQCIRCGRIRGAK